MKIAKPYGMVVKTKKQENFMRKINFNFDWLYSEEFDESMLASDAKEKGFEKSIFRIPTKNFHTTTSMRQHISL